MISRRTTILLTVFILGIIIFDAMQQKFYVDTFNLVPDEEIQLWPLLQSHFLRWLVWALFSIPLCLVSWKLLTKEQDTIPVKSWFVIGGTTTLVLIASLASVSVLNDYLADSTVSMASFREISVFITYQKGMSFLFASSLLILILYNRSKALVIDAQWLEIKNLKSGTNGTEVFDEPNISIKIGNKVKLIPLEEVTWIEADDYCVKIHTQEKAYTLRQSLKSLEEQLAPYHFIRVHRKALLNMGYLDHVDFSSSVIRLEDHSELPLSRSGAQELRKVLEASSI